MCKILWKPYNVQIFYKMKMKITDVLGIFAAQS